VYLGKGENLGGEKKRKHSMSFRKYGVYQDKPSNVRGKKNDLILRWLLKRAKEGKGRGGGYPLASQSIGIPPAAGCNGRKEKKAELRTNEGEKRGPVGGEREKGPRRIFTLKGQNSSDRLTVKGTKEMLIGRDRQC